MSKTLHIQIRVIRQKLSQASIEALHTLGRYNCIAFTSKNARKFFTKELQERHITFPPQSHIIHVGPRADLLKFPLDNKRILFPRSDIAPFDIVRHLRKRGAVVRVVPLYTTSAIPLSPLEMRALLASSYTRLTFKSPSGVQGLMKQLSAKEKQTVRKIQAQCIGSTTAQAAREAGFKKISTRRI